MNDVVGGETGKLCEWYLSQGMFQVHDNVLIDLQWLRLFFLWYMGKASELNENFVRLSTNCSSEST